MPLPPQQIVQSGANREIQLGYSKLSSGHYNIWEIRMGEPDQYLQLKEPWLFFRIEKSFQVPFSIVQDQNVHWTSFQAPAAASPDFPALQSSAWQPLASKLVHLKRKVDKDQSNEIKASAPRCNQLTPVINLFYPFWTSDRSEDTNSFSIIVAIVV